MFARILTVAATLLTLAACSTTADKAAPISGNTKAAAGETQSVSQRFRVASESLEPFTEIAGSSIGAKASDRVFFGFDSASLSSDSRATLDRQVKWLKENENSSVTIEGHCDERGTREYNLALGDRRANSVKNYLVNSGIDSNRVKTVSYGKERPAVLGSDDSAWAENRRAVTTIN